MFKVGDKVKRIKNDDYSIWAESLSLGGLHDLDGVYTVSDIHTEDVNDWQPSIKLEEVACCYWAARNFELVETAKEPKNDLSQI